MTEQERVNAIIDRIETAVDGEDMVLVVAALESMLVTIVHRHADDHDDALAGIEAIAGDMRDALPRPVASAAVN